ncbi:imidazolonepropionase-like amidohydrolase [Murinocardiopsis flavida]|uniref:Imidazolonepropionase-like amidohydrolase n=1 Tax=Murinocardiopsis flavida TaxID=645275 RepID=A0A2P8CMQ7_9ACTN|nr:amidohydrolase family protein [Murinocardiopsis flavida]PSK86220.1 imidazolonepropionase-like amidohydrolase [Murinocardiopsis flavida]
MYVKAPDLLIRGARVFTGDAVLARADVAVTDGLITAVSGGTAPARASAPGGDGAAPAPGGAEVVDGRGRTLLPGLIDAHAHVFPGCLEQAVLFGATTVLDLMADPAAIGVLRRQAAGTPAMADVRTAGTAATVPDGYGKYLVDMGYLPPFPTLTEPGQAAAFVDARVAEGADFIKILIDDGSTTGTPLPRLRDETVAALVEHSHARGMLTIAHALTAADAATAVRAGVDVLGHLYVDGPGDPEFPDLLADQGTAVIPTLAVLDGLFGRTHGADLLADPRVEPHLDGFARQMLGFGPIPLGPGAVHDLDVPAETLGRLHDAGVTVLAGSDASNADTAHGATLHLELGLMVRAGLTPVAALTAATSAPADRFGLADRGRIAPGLRADLLLVEGDPTASIDATLDIAAVWRGGVRIGRGG